MEERNFSRRQRQQQADALQKLRSLYPDEPLSVLRSQLQAHGWILANAIDALDATRESSTRETGQTNAPPKPFSSAKAADEWVLIEPIGMSTEIDEVQPACDTSTLSSNSRASTSEQAQQQDHPNREQDAERKRRAELQQLKLQEAERRWEEEKKRQEEAQQIRARIKESELKRKRMVAEVPPERQADPADDPSAENRQGTRMSDALAQSSLHLLRTQLEHHHRNADLLVGTKAIPFRITQEEAANIFHQWRLALWFAPTDFSQLAEPPSQSMIFIPYYKIDVESICTYKCNVEFLIPREEGQHKELKVVAGTRKNRHTQRACAAQLPPEIQEIMASIVSWDLLAEMALSLPSPGSGAASRDISLSTAPLLHPRDVWPKAEECIVSEEKKACATEILSSADGVDEKPTRVLDATISKMEYQGLRYEVIYVPIYLVRYIHGDNQSGSQEFTFGVNGFTGASHGKRPYGVGRVLGRGISFLEGLFGLKDNEKVDIVSGRVLSSIDGHWYITWPASHSYLVTYDVGFITIRNRSQEHSVVLSSQKRESKAITASYVLGPGETQSFNYRGLWCIQLRIEPSQEIQSGLRPATPGLDEPHAIRWHEVIEVVQYSVDGGQATDLLGMA